MSVDWAEVRVAADRSHHRIGDRPLYAERFDAVGKFHAPGLAPVRREGRAWHVDLRGRPAYEDRYVQTFGYYEGRAAVDTGAGWVHVDSSGVPLSPARYQWCGNFQGQRAPVRDEDGRYFHCSARGDPAYAQRWRYAGDYRDGRAVVQRADGLHSHIDLDGELVHGRWFLDLDVFHKGHARARDEGGWMHVDEAGQPIYSRRFAAVEPFYNGQARVEGPAGELMVIDERGAPVVELRPARGSEFEALSRTLVGYWDTHTIATAVARGVFDALPAEERALGAALELPVERARRLLRALAELGLLRREASGRWQLTARGELLQREHPCSLADAACEYAGRLRRPWLELDAALADPSWPGKLRFEDIAADDPRRHHRMLRSYARHDYPEIADAILGLDLRGDEEIVDAGGGLGVLAGLLRERAPGLRVTVLERPELVAMLPETIPGRVADLFAPWPVAEVDRVILARVLHDWDEAEARAILVNARRALAPEGRVLIVEQILDAEMRGGGGLVDLHLLVSLGGRERELEGWRALLASAELELTRVVPTARVPAILEARRR